jgi:alpha-tubulin suppressor-like RCC1 family protein
MWCDCQVEGAVDIAAIAAGGFHNMALNRAGEVLTWGTNDYGQLGNGSTSYNMEPSKVGFRHSAQQQEWCAAFWRGLPV